MSMHHLSDTQGSVLYNFFAHGKLERSEGSSITEGIGQGRVTENLQGAPIDSAVLILDEEAVSMVRPGVNFVLTILQCASNSCYRASRA